MDAHSTVRPPASRPVLRWAFVWRWLLALLCRWAARLRQPAGQRGRARHRPPSTRRSRRRSASWCRQRRAQAGARSDSGFRLLDSVDAAFASRLALIERRQRSLDLQYYAIHADASTESCCSALRDAARRGVRVRILLDDFNTVGEDAQVLRLAFEPNVEMRLFNPLPGSRGSLSAASSRSLHDVAAHPEAHAQQAVHRRQRHGHHRRAQPRATPTSAAATSSNFVDLDVLAAGRIVRDMSASFDRYWNDELAYPDADRWCRRKDLEELRKPTAGARPTRAAAAKPAPSAAAADVTPPSCPRSRHGGRQRRPAADGPAQGAADLGAGPLLVDKPGKIGPGDDEVDAGDTVVDGLLHLMQQARAGRADHLALLRAGRAR